MRKIFAIITVAVTLLYGSALAEGEALVCRWDFDGSLQDTAGAVRDNLTPRGGRVAARFVTAAQLPGTSGKAIAIGVKRGDAEYFTAAISKDVKLPASYTIEAWIHATQLPAWGRLVLHWGGTGRYAYHFALHGGVVSLCHGQADGKYIFAEGGRVSAGMWHHIAGIARRNDAAPTRSTLEVYLDGRRVGTAAYDGTIRTLKTEGLGVGDSVGIPGRDSRYRGYIDELAVWGRALSAEEIRAHHAKRADVLRKLYGARLKAEAAARAKKLGQLAALGIEEIVFAERGAGRDPSGHYYANFGYSCIDPNYWIHSADGGKLTKLNVRTGELTVLVDDPQGAVRDPQVHHDGKKILFSYRKGTGHHYNLYEVNSDATGLRQITRGAWDDIEPTYLPNGDIVFCSTRCKRYIGCWLAQTAVLYRCDAGGKNIRMLSSGSFTENTPAVLPDGRVMYTRWEYVNRDPVSFHHLWTINPDGTGQMVYFGNMRPGGVFIDAKPIPGTDSVVMINSPGHGRNEHTGYVAVITDTHGPNARGAMRNVTRSGHYRDPDPISRDAFLVAKGNQIVLISSRGQEQVLHTAGGMVHEPRAVIKRQRERVLPSRADLTRTTATLVLTDVYRGRNMAGVQRGNIKKLLVLEDLPKPANYHGGGSQPIGHGVTTTLKRILGTVPVEADGSACFEVPPMRSIYFAALDKNGLSVKQMRSFVTLQPGETTGCVGCHEHRTQAPRKSTRESLAAMRRPPSRIEPIAELPSSVMDFPRDVQPILDRHCVKCHNHEKRTGGVVLAGDRGPVFSHSYYTLFLHWQVKDTGGQPRHGSGRQPGNDKPYAAYSSASPLVMKVTPHDAGGPAGGTHNKVNLTPRERRTIRLWIDAGAQYPGTYAAYGTGQIGGCWGNNRPVRVMADAWPSATSAKAAMRKRCGGCHVKQIPMHVTDRIPLDAWGDMLSWTRPLSRFSRHRLYNLSRPDKSLVLLAPLARKAGGYADGKPAPAKRVREDRARPPKPVVHRIIFADTSDPDYRKVLAHIEAAKLRLDEIRRFDQPDFRPRQEYVREMQRYGVLPANFDLAKDPINVYAVDQAYWQSLWWKPRKR